MDLNMIQEAIKDYSELKKLYLRMYLKVDGPFYKNKTIDILIRQCDTKIRGYEENLNLGEYDDKN